MCSHTQVIQLIMCSVFLAVKCMETIFIGSTDSEAETSILWPPDVKNWLIGKDPDAGKDWRREEKGTTEDEMVGWHHRLDGHEFEQALGVGDGQGSLVCCSPWGHKELDMTEQLNWLTDWLTAWVENDTVEIEEEKSQSVYGDYLLKELEFVWTLKT